MVLKKDDDGRRWIELEYLVPGTPEQVWQAIATGPGMRAWFTPTTVEERVGGAIEFDFGEGMGTSRGVVTQWQPPMRFGYEEHDWSGEAPPLATEVVVTSHSGDRCVVRMVHSLFTDRDDWDDEIEGFETGWAGFFEVLRVYLSHFAGQPAVNVHVMTTHSGDLTHGWSALSSALGISGVDVGGRYESPSGAPALVGVMARIQQDSRIRDVMVRLTEPMPGIAVVGSCEVGDRTMLMVSIYFYGEAAGDTAASEQPKWQAWMAQLGDAHSAAT